MKTTSNNIAMVLFIMFFSFYGCKPYHNEKANEELNSFTPTLLIHGGAGTISKENLSPEIEKEYRLKLEEALNAGYEVLNNDGTSIDAIIAAIKILEDSPLFNAGKGAVFTHDGKNELDASIMDGNTGEAGAVSGVRTVKNPISAALCVMKQSKHVLLTGNGAQEFAKQNGLTLVEPDYFFTERRHNQLLDRQKKENVSNSTNALLQDNCDNYKFGTVGAVALDKYGNLAAG
ncbi:MAG: isoaspartyl peptidase/L-asparaginase, partial [Bacteroidales bacterium]|nr:isoaspartyl peptidase/L-asparaginase [Bacteroidales bacterium]